MLPVNFAFLVTLLLSFLKIDHAGSRKVAWDEIPTPTGCMNCTVCQYPCHPLNPPPPNFPLEGVPPPPAPLSGYPIYGSSPPPPPLSGYPEYGAPPSPPSQVNCSPFPVQCCPYPPPYPVGYEPYGNYSTPCSPLYLASVMAFLLCVIVLF